MKPSVSSILHITATQLMTDAVPNLNTSYLQGTTAIHALLLRFAAFECEQGAEIRAEENTGMRTLFAELADRVRDPALKEKLVEAAASRDTTAFITALDTANAALRKLLIALHVHLEEQGSRDGEKRVWRLLKAMAARREVSLLFA